MTFANARPCVRHGEVPGIGSWCLVLQFFGYVFFGIDGVQARWLFRFVSFPTDVRVIRFVYWG